LYDHVRDTGVGDGGGMEEVVDVVAVDEVDRFSVALSNTRDDIAAASPDASSGVAVEADMTLTAGLARPSDTSAIGGGERRDRVDAGVDVDVDASSSRDRGRDRDLDRAGDEETAFNSAPGALPDSSPLPCSISLRVGRSCAGRCGDSNFVVTETLEVDVDTDARGEDMGNGEGVREGRGERGVEGERCG
jgi:hypothetical protein